MTHTKQSHNKKHTVPHQSLIADQRTMIILAKPTCLSPWRDYPVLK